MANPVAGTGLAQRLKEVFEPFLHFYILHAKAVSNTLWSLAIPASGLLYLQLGGQGSVVYYQMAKDSEQWNLNQGTALTSGSLYEFTFHVTKGQQLWITGAKVLGAWLRGGR
jgi:hypothetical protein